MRSNRKDIFKKLKITIEYFSKIIVLFLKTKKF